MRLLIFIVILFSGVYSQEDNTPSTNPCEDPIYKQLVVMSLDSMSERQYSYFTKIHEECREFQAEEEARAIKADILVSIEKDRQERMQKIAEYRKKSAEEEKVLMAILWTCLALSIIAAIAVSI